MTQSSPSSCDYWGDEDLNPAVLDELAVFEANQVASTSRLVGRRSPSETMPPLSTNPESEDSFDPFNVDIQDLRGLDAATEDYRRKEAAARAAPASVSPPLPTHSAVPSKLHCTRPTAKLRNGTTLLLRRQGRKGKLGKGKQENWTRMRMKRTLLSNLPHLSSKSCS